MAPGPSIDSAPPSAAEGGERIAGGPPDSERPPREGQEWPPPRAVSGSAEAAKGKGRLLRPKYKRDRRQRLPQEDPEKLGTQGLPSKPGASGPSAPPQEDHVHTGLARFRSRTLAPSRGVSLERHCACPRRTRIKISFSDKQEVPTVAGEAAGQGLGMRPGGERSAGGGGGDERHCGEDADGAAGTLLAEPVG